MNTAQKAEQLLKKTVEELGYELCDVEFVKEYGDWVLTLYIDRPGGVTIDDCERVSRAVDPILDEADPIEQQYFLSVSSLGLDRPLKKDADFQRNLGKRIEIKLFAPVNGTKELRANSFVSTRTILRFASGRTNFRWSERPLRSPDRNWCFSAEGQRENLTVCKNHTQYFEGAR